MSRLVLLLLAAVLLWAPSPAVAAAKTDTPATSAAPATPTAEAVSLESLSAAELRALVVSEAAKGKAVRLVFWATWCGPCLREIPDLMALRKAYPEDKLAILGVSVDQDKIAAEQYLRRKPVNYRMLHGQPDVVKSYGLTAIPRQILYRKITGEALHDAEGMLDPIVFRSLIDMAVK